MLRLSRYAVMFARWGLQTRLAGTSLRAQTSPTMVPMTFKAVDMSDDAPGQAANQYISLLEKSAHPDEALKIFLGAKLQKETGGLISRALLSRLLKFSLVKPIDLYGHPAFSSLSKVFSVNCKFIAMNYLADITQLLLVLGALNDEALLKALVDELERRVDEMTPTDLGSYLRVVRSSKIPDSRRVQLLTDAVAVVTKDLEAVSLDDGGRFVTEVLQSLVSYLPGEHSQKLWKSVSANVEEVAPRLFVPLLRCSTFYGQEGEAAAQVLIDYAKKNSHLFSERQLSMMEVGLEKISAASDTGFYQISAEDRAMYSLLRTLTLEDECSDEKGLQKVLSYFMPNLRSKQPMVFTSLSILLVKVQTAVKPDVKEKFVRAFLDRNGKEEKNWSVDRLAAIFNRSVILVADQPITCKDLIVWGHKTFATKMGEVQYAATAARVVRSFVDCGFYSKTLFTAVAQAVEEKLDDAPVPVLIALMNTFSNIRFFHPEFMSKVTDHLLRNIGASEFTRSLQLRLLSTIFSLNYANVELAAAIADKIQEDITSPSKFILGRTCMELAHLGIFRPSILKKCFEGNSSAALKSAVYLVAKKACPDLKFEGAAEASVESWKKANVEKARLIFSRENQQRLQLVAALSTAFGGKEYVNRVTFTDSGHVVDGCAVYDKAKGCLVPCANAGLIKPGTFVPEGHSSDDLVFIGFMGYSGDVFARNEPKHWGGIVSWAVKTLDVQNWKAVVVNTGEFDKHHSSDDKTRVLLECLKEQTGIELL